MASTLPSVNSCCDACNGMVVEYNPPTPSGNVGWFVVETIAALRALPNLTTNVYAYAEGDLVIDDGGGGPYMWRSTALDADDGITWIKPDDTNIGAPGRWKKP